MASTSAGRAPYVEQAPVASARAHSRINILNVPVSAINMEAAVGLVREWLTSGEGRTICVADVHSVMRARDDAAHAAALHAADMITPDGAPLSVVGRLRGHRHMGRVCGPDLMLRLCAASVEHGWRNFLLGGAPGVADELAEAMSTMFPGVQIVGKHSPPFRLLTSAEDREIIDTITSLKPDILWVGLGCPKQERWMLEHRDCFPSTILIGVGAAFDFHSGRIERAPTWMRRRGLEWLHRLINEPKRLWRRYLLLAPRFLVLAAVETIWAHVRPNQPRTDHGAA